MQNGLSPARNEPAAEHNRSSDHQGDTSPVEYTGALASGLVHDLDQDTLACAVATAQAH
jgi:hypothetical protein